MNEKGAREGGLSQLAALAVRLRANQAYMAWALGEYGREEHLGEDEVASVLGLDPTMFTRLALCRRPDSTRPDFGQQVQQIAEYTGMDAAVLAALLRQVESVSALATLPSPALRARPALSPLALRPGLLSAAHDRVSHSEPIEGVDESGPDEEEPDATAPAEQAD